LKKITRAVRVINEKNEDRIAISAFERSRSDKDVKRNPIPLINTFSKTSNRIYLQRGFKDVIHLRKSFMAV
jgi:glycerophosphoryl diester phosphodiesterase